MPQAGNAAVAEAADTKEQVLRHILTMPTDKPLSLQRRQYPDCPRACIRDQSLEQFDLLPCVSSVHCKSLFPLRGPQGSHPFAPITFEFVGAP